MTPRIVEIEPLRTGIVLPTIVSGYDITECVDQVVAALPNDVTDWTVLIGQHSAAGSAST